MKRIKRDRKEYEKKGEENKNIETVWNLDKKNGKIKIIKKGLSESLCFFLALLERSCPGGKTRETGTISKDKI